VLLIERFSQHSERSYADDDERGLLRNGEFEGKVRVLLPEEVLGDSPDEKSDVANGGFTKKEVSIYRIKKL
jgi:hypothetical protein